MFYSPASASNSCTVRRCFGSLPRMAVIVRSKPMSSRLPPQAHLGQMAQCAQLLSAASRAQQRSILPVGFVEHEDFELLGV